MFSKETYIGRRAELCRRVGKGLILLPGNPEVPNNYPNNTYYYRQDSTFRYYFGLDVPSLIGLLDAESGEAMLFGDDFTVEDIIWTGPMRRRPGHRCCWYPRSKRERTSRCRYRRRC